MKQRQKSYDGVSLCAPITIPYQRFSSETAHWWAGAALKELNSKYIDLQIVYKFKRVSVTY